MRLHRQVPAGVLLSAVALAVPSIAWAVPPSNDAFAGRQPVVAVPFEDNESTDEATTEPGEPESPCGPMGKTVWYEYTPPTDVVLKADTRGSSYDTMLAVWTGSGLGSLTHVGCSDDIFGFESRVVFQAAGGTPYLFQVGGFEDAGGALKLVIQEVDAGVISGTVTDEASGAPLGNICVDVFDADFFTIISDSTNAAGQYGIPVRSGRYLVTFSDWCDQSNEHRTEWYDNRPDFQSADEVEVVGTSQVGNIDAALAPSCPGAGDLTGAQFIGTPGPDTFVGGPAAEIFCGMEGADRMSGRGGRDFLSGSEGRDRLSGGRGNDFLEGGGERDRLSGGADNDDLFGDEGRDQLGGGGGDDDLFGERDSDVLRGGPGARDLCNGGKGRDRVNRTCERVFEVP
jgi:Ca2+-binding RTX toxin-like protein